MKRSVRQPKGSFSRKRGSTTNLSSGRSPVTMRQGVSIASMVIAAALLVYGMAQPIEQDSRWILSLWLAAPLLLLTIRFSLPKAPHGAARSIQNLAIVVAVGFTLLSFELLRQQFVRSHEIYNFVYTDEQTGQSSSNIRPIRDAQRVKRGQIVDSTGRVLASSHVTNGLATRTYPIEQEFDPTYFGNVLGYFSDRFGQSGLELTYSDYLSGEHDAWSRWQDWMLGKPRVGSDLHLTLSAPLQAAAGQILAGRTGSIVVLNPKTGAVLAMASGPNFDPRGLATNNDAEDGDADSARVGSYWNEITSDSSGQPLINRPVQGRYPPGSTYKTVTAIGALENPQEGRPDDIDCPNERMTDEGAPPVVNAVNNLFTRTGNPSNLEHVYAFSCNTAFAEYAMRLGQAKEVEIAQRFDIYRPQDMPDSYDGFTDLPTRASQIYVDPGFLNTRAAVADTGYGQGQLLVTPLQMAMVAAAVANDGVMMRPYLVDHVTRPDGTTIFRQGSSAIRRVMSSETAAKMRVNMRAGVEYGFGKAAQQVDPSVALVGGKSGTAENAPGATPHAWFIAIAPVDNPRYAVAVMIENGGEGSSVGARAAGDVLAAAFSLEQ